MLKRILTVSLAILLVVSLAGCGSTQPTQAEAPKYQDGIYFAQEDAYSEKSGWKYVLTMEVKDGKIASVDWTGAHKSGGADKKSLSAAGKYGMVAKGGAQAEWHEQAAKVEAFLLENQDPAKITVDAEGKTDGIAGVSVGVDAFVKLAQEALANGPVGKGAYADGAYYAEQVGYGKGWKYNVSLTVINGNIVSADWNAVNINGGPTKKALSAEGQYQMVAKGGAQAEWHEQAAKAEAYLLEVQDPAKIAVDAEGATDDIAGVSIGVDALVELTQKALANGPIAEGSYKDGFYNGQEKEFSEKGWKYVLHIAVKNGSIVGADWTAVPKEKGDDKDTLSRNGEYGMVAKGGAQAEWHEQAEKAEAYLIQVQDPAKITYDAEGATDDIAGVSIGVDVFSTLAQEALKDAK